MSDTEEKINHLSSLFVGTGVIWTAIGMRNALLASLGNIDAASAAEKGAFHILNQLVEGGILLSLSTTIVGGVGCYIMRTAKTWALGRQLNMFFDTNNLAHSNKILEKLDSIIFFLKKTQYGR